MEYPTDLDLNKNKDIYIDSANDLALTSGIQQLQQSVAIDVMDITRQFIGQQLTGTQVGLLEERVERSLNNDEQVAEVQTVNLVEFDRRDNSIELDIIVVKDEDFTLEVSA